MDALLQASYYFARASLPLFLGHFSPPPDFRLTLLGFHTISPVHPFKALGRDQYSSDELAKTCKTAFCGGGAAAGVHRPGSTQKACDGKIFCAGFLRQEREIVC